MSVWCKYSVSVASLLNDTYLSNHFSSYLWILLLYLSVKQDLLMCAVDVDVISKMGLSFLQNFNNNYHFASQKYSTCAAYVKIFLSRLYSTNGLQSSEFNCHIGYKPVLLDFSSILLLFFLIKPYHMVIIARNRICQLFDLLIIWTLQRSCQPFWQERFPL